MENSQDNPLGWDTHQFPNNVAVILVAFYHIFSNGGLGKGGLNFDAKILRQSIDPEDLFYAHIGGMDICAKTLIAVEKLINDNEFSKYINKRYENWSGDLGNFIHDSKTSLDIIHKKVIEDNIEPKPKSGQQEFLENLI